MREVRGVRWPCRRAWEFVDVSARAPSRAGAAEGPGARGAKRPAVRWSTTRPAAPPRAPRLASPAAAPPTSATTPDALLTTALRTHLHNKKLHINEIDDKIRICLR